MSRTDTKRFVVVYQPLTLQIGASFQKASTGKSGRPSTNQQQAQTSGGHHNCALCQKIRLINKTIKYFENYVENYD